MTINFRRITVATAMLLALLVSTLMAFPIRQDKSNRPSPPGTADLTLSGKKIMIEYSRPSMRGRKIYGGLVPYDQVWRTGANEATTFKTEADLSIAGTNVPKGAYTLYTLPSANGWKLIINKQTGQWGTEYNESQDLARINMQVEQLSSPVEQFTISLTRSGMGGMIRMDWENTRAFVLFREKK